MPNYSEGKIYKIVSEKTSSIYVGSTTQALKERFRVHKKNLDSSSRELLDFDDAKIVLIEDYPCESGDELRIREEYYRELNKEVCVNLIKAYTSVEEIAENKKKYKLSEKGIETQRKYEQSGKQRESQRIYRQSEKGKESAEKRSQPFLCECGSTVTLSHKARHLKTEKHKKSLTQ